MTITEWIVSPLVTGTLIAALAWLGKGLIVTRLKATVQHEFDLKLEELRAELRRSEESFKAVLRSKEMDIAALRGGALTAMANRQAALDKRRMEAIDHLWAAIDQLTPYKNARLTLASINFQNALELASTRPDTRTFFGSLGGTLDPQVLGRATALSSRPYVSEFAWALFSAYRAILGFTAAQFIMLKGGINKPELLEAEPVMNLAKSALPDYSEYIEQHGHKVFHHLLELIEKELLKELQRIMRGEESDKESVGKAAKIMQEVESVNMVTSKAAVEQSS